MMYYVLTDAQEMNRKHPDTFEVPSESELKKVKIGSSVKIIFNNKERMWVKVTKKVGNNLEGTLDNDPMVIKSVRFGDVIKFHKKNIASIYG